jgi:CRISPR/Cas system-associated exonuclease Cas4 (RecB family)
LGESSEIAWESIVSHFAAVERLDIYLGQPPRKLDRRAALALLTDIGTHESLPRTVDDVGRVRVVSAPSARSITAPHLYIAGMSEQSFPQPRLNSSPAHFAREGEVPADPFATFDGSAGASPSQVTPPTPTQDEMLLFYEVLSRAQRSLTITYPAMDDKAQELPPSPYIIELQRIFRGSERAVPRTKPQLSPVPRDTSLYSVVDWRTAAVSRAVEPECDRRLLTGLLQHSDTRSVGQAIDAGIRAVHARARGEAFGPYEGLLSSPAIAARLARRFGKQHTWSPSQLETYASCPYKFFLESVLKLEPLGDLVLETDFARRGSLLHQVLATFHRKYDASTPDQWRAMWNDDSRFASELQATLEAAVGSMPREGIEAALVELDRRQIDKWTGLYRGQHEKYDKAWSTFDEPPQPAFFELRFGRKHPGEAGHEDPHSKDDAFPLDIGGEKINIAGRIDRIDVGRVAGQTVFNVIDYKSGKRPTLTADKIESGERLQPALYVMAAQALLFEGDDASPMWAGYWSMQGGVNTDKRYSLHCSVKDGTPSDTWEKLRPKVVARIAEIVRAARNGNFPVASCDPNCTSMCEYKTVCRVSQVRSLGKVWIKEIEPPSRQERE